MPDALDCAPQDAAAWHEERLSVDGDGDGRGTGTDGVRCVGAEIPLGLSATGDDCDDADASIHLAVVRYPDRDGDRVGATPRAIFCIGPDEPAGHSRGWDVDDTDPAVSWDRSDEELLHHLL